MYTGSMCGAGLHVFGVWNYVIANADARGYLEINPKIVSTVLGCKPEEVQAGIDYLSEVDSNSHNPAEEGRRIVREGQRLYRIVSYMYYREMRDAEAKREYDRAYVAARRAERREAKERPITTSRTESESVVKNTTNYDMSYMSPQAEAEAEEEVNTTTTPARVVDTWNRLTDGKLPKAKLTDKRAGVIRTRLKEDGWFADFEAALAYILADPWYTGGNDRNWVATLDFLLQAGKSTQLAERAEAKAISGAGKPKPPQRSLVQQMADQRAGWEAAGK
jgi:hypothetical protein